MINNVKLINCNSYTIIKVYLCVYNVAMMITYCKLTNIMSSSYSYKYMYVFIFGAFSVLSSGLVLVF